MRLRSILMCSRTDTGCIRRSAIEAQKSSSGRTVVLNSRVCFSGATSQRPTYLLPIVRPDRESYSSGVNVHMSGTKCRDS